MIASITGWKPAWPAITAFSIVSSESSLASDSTISTASPVPATTRSRVEVLHLLDRRVDLDLALDDADPGRADRAHERHAGQRQRGGGGDHRQNVGIVLEVIGEHGRDDLRLAAELVGEQRADRPVDQARRQRLALGRAAFALEVAAGNAAGGEGLLLIVDGEGEEVLAGLGRLLARRRWRARWSRPRWRARRRRPDGRCGRFPARACARTSRVLHVECQTSFFILRYEDAKACGPCRPCSSGSSSARRRGAGRNCRSSPRRSCHDARLFACRCGRRPHAAARVD